MARRKDGRENDVAVLSLLSELAHLRELDRRRHAHKPGTAADAAAIAEVDAQNRRVMDRFRAISVLPAPRRLGTSTRR